MNSTPFRLNHGTDRGSVQLQRPLQRRTQQRQGGTPGAAAETRGEASKVGEGPDDLMGDG